MKTCFRLFLFLLTMTASSLILADTFRFEISGIQGRAQKNAVAQLQAEADTLPENPSPSQLDDFMKTAPVKVKKALEPFGYFMAQVKISPLLHNKSGITASLHVYPGPPLNWPVCKSAFRGTDKPIPHC